MIFVYPSVISENVPEHMYPALAKTLEQFYLLHILESISNGNLRFKSVYHPGKKVYGPLLLEHKKDSFNMPLLTERSVLNTSDFIFNEIETELDNILDTAWDINNGVSKQPIPNANDKSSLSGYISDLDIKINELNSAIDDCRTCQEFLHRLSNPPPEAKRLIRDISRDNKTLNNARSVLNDKKKMAKDLLRQQEDDKDKKAREKEKHGWEKKTKEDEEKDKAEKQARHHGQYKVKDATNVSLEPTMSTISVRIQYIGGPSAGVGSVSQHENQEINVGVKVIPGIVTNFSSIQNVLLDDYFATTAARWYKRIYRTSLRHIFRFTERAVNKITGKNVDIAKFIKDPITRMILLSPQGMVNAASFKSNTMDTPSFYKFSAASVMMRTDDITNDYGENFFKNKSAMNKLFKMGWNTFVVLNEIDEIAYFISSLDGGSLHMLPYSYMFKALNMDKIYDSDEFKRLSRGFQIRSGNMGTLAGKLARESALIESIRRLS